MFEKGLLLFEAVFIICESYPSWAEPFLLHKVFFFFEPLKVSLVLMLYTADGVTI